METLTKQEALLRKEELLKRIEEGAIFIHPTDTIYGLGCNSLDEEAVKKIKKIKERNINNFSVWVPSINWIENNCKNSKALKIWIEKLPGPYTLITKLKNKNSVANGVYNNKDKTLGVRMPKHWFKNLVEELNIPIVTTSANKTGKEFMTSLENLDPEVQKEVEFIIYEGEKKARPSRIVNLEEEKVISR